MSEPIASTYLSPDCFHNGHRAVLTAIASGGTPEGAKNLSAGFARHFLKHLREWGFIAATGRGYTITEAGHRMISGGSHVPSPPPENEQLNRSFYGDPVPRSVCVNLRSIADDVIRSACHATGLPVPQIEGVLKAIADALDHHHV